MQNDLVIRAAQAEDADKVVELIYSSAPELFPYMFDTSQHTVKDFIRHEFIQGGGFMGHRIHMVATKGEDILGIGAFYSGAWYHKLSLQTVGNIFRFYGLWAGFKVLLRANHSASVMAKPKKSQLYIADLGVAENSRGLGVGSALIEHHTQSVKNRGITELVLDVALINPRAEALYQRLGFAVVSEKEFKGGEGAELVPGTRRMIRSL